MNTLADPPITSAVPHSTLAPARPHEPASEPVAAPEPCHRADQIAQTIALTILFAVPALFALHAACVYDPDAWWHLRTGEWIARHHTVPFTDTFSSTTAGRPWQAYSWLFELLLFTLYTKLGLLGIVAYTTTMVLAITAALHHLIRGRQRDFSLTLLLTLAASLALIHLHTPRPWHFTILFFIVELDLILRARRTGRTGALLVLPILFALWANLHIQFIDGLAILGIAAAEPFVSRFLLKRTSDETAPQLNPLALTGIALASVAATLVTPYSWHLYQAAYDLVTQLGVADGINELKAVPFRDLPDWVLLTLALGACAALGKAKKLPLFETALFILAAYLSFHSQRDVWVLATVSIAILAAAIPGSAKAKDYLPTLTPLVAVTGAAIACLVGVRTMGLNQQGLETQLTASLPVHAAEFVQHHHIAGPTFNNFTWGGYLIWALPQNPVSIDGRAALHGTPQIDRSERTLNGKPDWATDPNLEAAGAIILDINAPLTQLLRADPRYRLAYEDKLAAVFTQKQGN